MNNSTSINTELNTFFSLKSKIIFLAEKYASEHGCLRPDTEKESFSIDLKLCGHDAGIDTFMVSSRQHARNAILSLGYEANFTSDRMAIISL